MYSFGDDKKSDRQKQEAASLALALELQEQEDAITAANLARQEQNRLAHPQQRETKQPRTNHHYRSDQSQVEADEAIARLEQEEENKKYAGNNGRHQPGPVQRPIEEEEIKEVDPAGKTNFDFFKESFEHSTYCLSSHYDVEKGANETVVVREKMGEVAPNEDAQKRFKAFLTTIAGQYVALFKKTPEPQWAFYRIPAIDKNSQSRTARNNFKAFLSKIFSRSTVDKNPRLELHGQQQKGQGIHIFQVLLDDLPYSLTGYILQTIGREKLWVLNNADEEKMGDDVINAVSATVFHIPVRIPAVCDESYDLFDLLKAFPDREGRIQCPFTTKFFLLEDIKPADDILEIIKYRNMVLAVPMGFLELLTKEFARENQQRIIGYLNFDCIIHFLTTCKKARTNLTNVKILPLIDLLLKQMIANTKNPLHLWKSEEQSVFLHALQHLPLKKQIAIIFHAFKNTSIEDITTWAHNRSDIELLLDSDDSLFMDSLLLKTEVQDVAKFTLSLVKLDEKKQEEKFRLLQPEDKQKILVHINSLVATQGSSQFDIFIGLMLVEHTVKEYADPSQPEKSTNPELIAAFFKHVAVSKQANLLFEKVSDSPEKCRDFIKKNKGSDLDIKLYRALLLSLPKSKQEQDPQIVKNIKSAWGLQTHQCEVELLSPDRCRIMVKDISPEALKNIPLDWVELAEEGVFFAETSVEKCNLMLGLKKIQSDVLSFGIKESKVTLEDGCYCIDVQSQEQAGLIPELKWQPVPGSTHWQAKTTEDEFQCQKLLKEVAAAHDLDFRKLKLEPFNGGDELIIQYFSQEEKLDTGLVPVDNKNNLYKVSLKICREKVIKNKIAAAYNLDPEEFKLHIDGQKYSIQITEDTKKSLTAQDELKWDAVFASKNYEALVSLVACDAKNGAKLRELKVIFESYKKNSLTDGCLEYPGIKRDIVEGMIGLIDDPSKTAENRILGLRKKCLDNQAALQSARFFPLHALGYLLGIVLAPAVVGILIIYSIWNRPVEGKKTLDEVQHKIGFRR